MMSPSPQSFVGVLKQNFTQIMVVRALAMHRFAEQPGTHHIQNHHLGMVVTAILHDQAVPPHLFRSINNFPALLDSLSYRNFCADMLTVTQRREYSRHLPLPWRRDVNKIQIVTTAKI